MCPLHPRDVHDPIEMRVEGHLDFPQAKELASRRAREVADEPMLLAWFDRARGAFSPRITCCREDRPSWLTYAESRGGDLVISLNEGDFVFIFRRT
jgi:hypothetical protein